MTTLQEALITASLNASAQGLISGSTNWAAFVAESLRTALAQQGNPVMFIQRRDDGTYYDALQTEHSCGMNPLYTDPQAQPLRELSAEELNQLWSDTLETGDPTAGNAHIRFTRAVLKKARSA